MTNRDALKQGEYTLKERIEHKADERTTDETLFDELVIKTYQLGTLVAEYHIKIDRLLDKERATIRKLKNDLENYKKAIKPKVKKK